MKKMSISEEVKQMKPIWRDFIVELGYTKEQGDKFAEGYANEIAKLSTLEKLRALSNQHDKCMSAGFKFAGIDEDEAFKRDNQGI